MFLTKLTHTDINANSNKNITTAQDGLEFSIT